MTPAAPPTAQPRLRGPPSRQPVSNMVTRGSAPAGTFHIPDDGFPVENPKSFLARFQAGLKVTDSNTLRSPDTYHQVHTKEVVAVNKQEGQVLVEAEEEGVKTVHGIVEEAEEELKPVLPTQPLRSPLAPEQSVEEVVEDDKMLKELELAADVAEDSLIEVVPAEVDLLSDRRATYPVLRFCAGNALVDQHALATLGLPLGFVWAPFGTLPHTAIVDRPAKRCGTCGSFLAGENGGVSVVEGSETWTCAFCGRDDNLAGDASIHCAADPKAYPELIMDAVEYAHAGGGGRTFPGRGAIVLVVDDNVEEEEASWTRAAAAAVHASAVERGLRFALLVVGAGCSVAAGYKSDEEVTPMLDMMTLERATKLTTEEKEQFFLGPPTAASTGPSSVQDDSRMFSQADTGAFVRARSLSWTEELVDKFGSLDAQDSPQVKTRFPPEYEQRRLDLAINIAFELISGMADAENSRILCLATGPPSLPPEMIGVGNVRSQRGLGKAANEDSDASVALMKLYEQIGARAGDLRIAIDFLCFGAPQGFAGPILLNASKRSRGGLVYSASHSFSAATALAEAATFLSERSNSPGLLSIRISTPLAVARVIGPAFPTAAPHTYAVPGIDPTIGFTVILKSKPQLEESELKQPVPASSYAVIQLTSKSLKSTRVITVRIPLVTESTEYLSNLDAELCALVLGKACAVSGGALTQPLIAARSIDVSARRLLRGSEASVGVVRLLYELRRGVLIERQVNPDCALVLRSFFLRGECSIASLLMSPRLFTNAMSEEGTGLMAEVPLEKSHVQKGSVLVLDTGFNVFVYVGEAASPEAEESISESARTVAAQRVSPCQLWKLHPGPDADYLLDWYLSPSGLPRGGVTSSSPTGQGFIGYCKSLAPDSITVRLLQSE